MSSFKAEIIVELEGEDYNELEDTNKPEFARPGIEDTTTPATYSVMFYYTPGFQAITRDIPGFIDEVLAVTNQGYANSKIPLTVTRFCIEAATINDQWNPYRLFKAFKKMKRTASALRNTADAAVLLSTNLDVCGSGIFNKISSGRTLSICAKSCVIGQFTLGHELGHNMGLQHNKEEDTNKVYPYGHWTRPPHTEGKYLYWLPNNHGLHSQQSPRESELLFQPKTDLSTHWNFSGRGWCGQQCTCLDAKQIRDASSGR